MQWQRKQSDIEQQSISFSLREYVDHRIAEQERFYSERFAAIKEMIQAEITAQKEAVTAAFASTQTAITKAEQAQKEYNALHNDLVRKMDDQAHELIQRVEAMNLFKVGNDRMDEQRTFLETKVDTQRIAFEKTIDKINGDISALRDVVSASSGQISGNQRAINLVIAVGGILIGIAGLISRLIK